MATSNSTVMIRRPAKAPGRISEEEPGCINIHMLRSHYSLLPFSFPTNSSRLPIPPMYGLFALLSLLTLVAAAPSPRQTPGKGTSKHHPEPFGRSQTSSPEVIIQLFQWNWDSIANECKNFIGPAGERTDLTLCSSGSTHQRGPFLRVLNPLHRIRLRPGEPRQ